MSQRCCWTRQRRAGRPERRSPGPPAVLSELASSTDWQCSVRSPDWSGACSVGTTLRCPPEQASEQARRLYELSASASDLTETCLVRLSHLVDELVPPQATSGRREVGFDRTRLPIKRNHCDALEEMGGITLGPSTAGTRAASFSPSIAEISVTSALALRRPPPISRSPATAFTRGSPFARRSTTVTTAREFDRRI